MLDVREHLLRDIEFLETEYWCQVSELEYLKSKLVTLTIPPAPKAALEIYPGVPMSKPISKEAIERILKRSREMKQEAFSKPLESSPMYETRKQLSYAARVRAAISATESNINSLEDQIHNLWKDHFHENYPAERLEHG